MEKIAKTERPIEMVIIIKPICLKVAKAIILLSSGILFGSLQRLTITDAAIIQFVLLKMGILMPETCRGL
jgi:hypothetical protein